MLKSKFQEIQVMNDTIIAGVDIGGSHITAALVDLTSTKIIHNTLIRTPIDSQSNADDIINSWTNVIQRSFEVAGIHPTKIGIAMPGPFDYVNGISYIRDQNKYDSLYGLKIKDLLAQKLGIDVRDIRITNDAASFVQGEVFAGSGRSFNRVIGLTLGTGLGSARSYDGEAEDANLWCSRFLNGIAEDYLSARWFISRYGELNGAVVKNVKELAELATASSDAQAIFNEFGGNLGHFLSLLVEEERPELIVLGGNISLAYPLFSTALESVLRNTSVPTEIRTGELGENAALIGSVSSYYKSSVIVP